MGKFKATIIFLLVVSVLGAGIYFKDNIIDFYNSASEQIDEQVKSFQKTDFSQVVSEVQKKVLAPSPLHVGGTESQVVLLKSKVIEQTNIQRQANGLPVLKENLLLDNAALAKANDMFENQYFEHVSLSGIDPGSLVANYGYNYIVAGENLILGNFSSEREVVDNWMQSPGHRENILNTRFSEIGVAMVKGKYKGETVWIGVQEFGLPVSACLQPDENLKTQLDLNKAQLDELSFRIDELKKQIDETNPRSAAYNQMINDYNQLVSRYNVLAEQVKSEIIQYNSQVNIFNNCVAGY